MAVSHPFPSAPSVVINEASFPPRLSMIRSNNGVVRINYQGQTNFLFVVQTSSNMVNWTTINTNIMTNGVMGYVDTAATNQSQRFYSATTLRTPLFYYVKGVTV